MSGWIKSHWIWLAVILGVLIVLVIGSFGFAATQEENDSFCASCHTQPESTFYERSQSGNPVDLASFHHTKGTKCIECHSGTGAGGRVSAMLLGARNAVAYFTHTAKQPAPLIYPIPDENCLKCHAKVLVETDMNNHFHSFLPRWQSGDPAAATCVDCHATHATDGDANIGFLNRNHTEQECQKCHNAMGED